MLFMLLFCCTAGILHKANFIIDAADGSIWQGGLAIVIGGLTAMFGCLAVSQLGKNLDSGATLPIMCHYMPRWFATSYSWFSYFMATPAVIAVLSWVMGVYTVNLFGLHSHGAIPVLVGAGYVVFLVVFNAISHKVAHKAQQITTVLKYAPLLFIAIWGLCFADDTIVPLAEHLHRTFEEGQTSAIGWLCALSPVAFCCEGWFAFNTLSKHSGNKKVECLIVVGSLFAISFYSLFYFGTAQFGLQIIDYGNDYLWEVLSHMFQNKVFSLIFMLFAIIAIGGTVDTMVMGHIHYAEIMADGYLLPEKFSINVGKKQIPILSYVLGFVSILIWLGLHWLVEETGFFKNGTPETDFAEIAMICNFALWSVLYVKTIKEYKLGNVKNAFLGVVCPVLALVGTGLFVLGGAINNPIQFLLYIGIALAVFALGVLYNYFCDKDQSHENWSDAYNQKSCTFLE